MYFIKSGLNFVSVIVMNNLRIRFYIRDIEPESSKEVGEGEDQDHHPERSKQLDSKDLLTYLVLIYLCSRVLISFQPSFRERKIDYFLYRAFYK
jgi:hypothetical protein